MDIHFLVFDEVEELDLVGPWELAGLLADRKMCTPPVLVTLNAMTPVGEHRMRFVADTHFSESRQPDVLFVPGGSGARVAMNDPEVVSYLQEHGRNGKSILSVCTGSYLLQNAGLLAGRRATTHWAFLGHLKADTSIDVVESRFVRDENIWTSGGVSAGMDMTLAFIADSFGLDTAADIQLDAEYFPSPRIYGRPFDREDVSAYIRELR